MSDHRDENAEEVPLKSEENETAVEDSTELSVSQKRAREEESKSDDNNCRIDVLTLTEESIHSKVTIALIFQFSSNCRTSRNLCIR